MRIILTAKHKNKTPVGIYLSIYLFNYLLIYLFIYLFIGYSEDTHFLIGNYFSRLLFQVNSAFSNASAERVSLLATKWININHVKNLNIFTCGEEISKFIKISASSTIQRIIQERLQSINQKKINNHLWNYLRKDCINCFLKENTAPSKIRIRFSIGNSSSKRHFITRMVLTGHYLFEW